MSNILMIIAQDGFRDEEYFEPKEIFDNHGDKVVTASIQPLECKGSQGGSVEADVSFKDVLVEDYDAIVICGGPGAPKLGNFAVLLDLIEDFNEQGKIIAAICIAPAAVLAKTSVLQGKKVTTWVGHGARPALEKAGADYVEEPVVVDGKIITADGPESAKAFAQKIIEVL